VTDAAEIAGPRVHRFGTLAELLAGALDEIKAIR
jgi:hypothetical protein